MVYFDSFEELRVPGDFLHLPGSLETRHFTKSLSTRSTNERQKLCLGARCTRHNYGVKDPTANKSTFGFLTGFSGN